MVAPADPLTRGLVVVLTLAATAVVPVWFATSADQGRKRSRPVPQPIAVEAPPAPDLGGLLAQSRSAAEGRNQAALTLCTAEITAVLGREFTHLYSTAESTAAEIATYRNCVTVIGMLASDTVRGRSDAHDWVRLRVEQRIEPRISECQREIRAVLDRFDRDLAASTLTMAAEMAAIGSTGSVSAVPHYTEGLTGLSLDEALGKLGFDGLVVTPAIALDSYALLHTRIVRWMITKVVEMAKWIFARPLAAAVTEAGLVVADGPLPIGDVIAALGAVWTAYDIYALRHHFEKELRAAVRESLPEARRSMEQQIWATLRERVASHADAQARMHDETTRELLR